MGQRYIPDVGLEYVPDDVFTKVQRYIVEENDVIISIVGTIGLVSIIDNRFHLASQTENCAKLSCPDRYDAYYLYYYLISALGQQEIKQATVGAVQAKLPLYNIEKISVAWPHRKYREQIVNVLSTLDDKIELNTQTNQTLEAIAQAIFKSWFVDFEPVKAKMAALEAGGTAEEAERAAMCAISGKDEAALTQLQTEQPDAYAELAQTAALFPSAMQDSELGEIPEGWDVQRLESLIELAYGKALKSTDRIEGTVPVYGSGGINGSHCKALVQGPGIIIGRKGTVGSIYWEQSDFFPIDTTFYVKTKENIPLEFAFYLLQTLGLNDMNTDAAVPGLNRNNVYRLEVPGFPNELIKRFTKVVSSISKAIQNLKVESNTLAEVRDNFLPKLLSGEIDLSQAADIADEASV